MTRDDIAAAIHLALKTSAPLSRSSLYAAADAVLALLPAPDVPETPGCCSFPKSADGRCPGCGSRDPAPDTAQAFLDDVNDERLADLAAPDVPETPVRDDLRKHLEWMRDKAGAYDTEIAAETALHLLDVPETPGQKAAQKAALLEKHARPTYAALAKRDATLARVEALCSDWERNPDLATVSPVNDLRTALDLP